MTTTHDSDTGSANDENSANNEGKEKRKDQLSFANDVVWSLGFDGLTVVANIVAFLLIGRNFGNCLLYTSPSPRDQRGSRMPSSA